MEIVTGNFYFVSDAFFEAVGDASLMRNKGLTKRPHYFAFRDGRTGLCWLVPCSSKLEKYSRLKARLEAQGRPSNRIMIVKLRPLDRKTALLFQDMFPIAPRYLCDEYRAKGGLVKISGRGSEAAALKAAGEIAALLRKGVKFSPTQPDVSRIERLMLGELAGAPA